jgi:hypothetical protein
LNKFATAKGDTWAIKSDTVKLRDHVVHIVTITGVVSNATTHGVKKVYITPILGNAESPSLQKTRSRQFGTETKGPWRSSPNLRHNSWERFT